eukprot:TRINITY_DN6542_c0_g1_i2.p1 TRINITY_DN6542_c0_g1~~TRINITY_DN6542_c0_g1_i2.p1  ORF type:complete len:445 (-),score=173.83 TRINITY_DN6542_c0_g1_i2:917-2251(-)
MTSSSKISKLFLGTTTSSTRRTGLSMKSIQDKGRQVGQVANRSFSSSSSSSSSSPLLGSLKPSSIVMGTMAIFTGITVAAASSQNSTAFAFEGSRDKFEQIQDTFVKSADVVIGDEKFMSIGRFVQLVLHTDAETAAELAKQMTGFIAIIDANHDGFISFEEFYGYIHLMESSDSSVEIAFKKFDLDNNGFVEKDEFERMIEVTHGKHALAFYESTGLLKKYFGSDGKKHMTLDDFRAFRGSVREELIRLEFRRVDRNRTGYVTGKQFAKLLERQHAVEEHAYVASSRNLARFHNHGGKFSEDSYVALVKMMDDIEPIENAIKKMTAGGHAINKKEFVQALNSSGCIATDEEVEIVWQLFDVDGDGTVSYAELIQVLRDGQSPLVKMTSQVSQSTLDQIRKDEAWARENKITKFNPVQNKAHHHGLAATMDNNQKNHIFGNQHK